MTRSWRVCAPTQMRTRIRCRKRYLAPISRSGDLWLLGNHCLRCGDATAQTDVEFDFGQSQAAERMRPGAGHFQGWASPRSSPWSHVTLLAANFGHRRRLTFHVPGFNIQLVAQAALRSRNTALMGFCRGLVPSSLTIFGLQHPLNAIPRVLFGIKRQAGFLVPPVHHPLRTYLLLRLPLALLLLLEFSQPLLQSLVHLCSFPVTSCG